MKIIRGNVTNDQTPKASLPGVIVTAVNDAATYNTTTDENGNFTLSVPDQEIALNFYTSFLTNERSFVTFTIPQPTPQIWNINLPIETGVVISAAKTNPMSTTKKVLLFGGLGLLALLLLTRKKRKKSKK